MINGFEHRAPNVIGRHVLTHGRLFDRSSRSSHTGRSIQQRVYIQTEVPSELQMLLLESGGLIAKPRVTEIGIGVGSVRIDEHSKLMCEDTVGHPPVRRTGSLSYAAVFRRPS